MAKLPTIHVQTKLTVTLSFWSILKMRLLGASKKDILDFKELLCVESKTKG